MKRRNFLGGTALAAGGLGAVAAVATAGETKTVHWRIQGFTCPTCAVGLEVMLRDQKGVRSAKASYPDASATVVFDPKAVSEARLHAYIAELGFKAETTQLNVR